MLSKYIIHSKFFKNVGHSYYYYYCYLKHRRATKMVKKSGIVQCIESWKRKTKRKQNNYLLILEGPYVREACSFLF